MRTTLSKVYRNHYLGFIQNRLEKRKLRRQPNLQGVISYPPGHFYSPLLDIEGLGRNDSNLPFDGMEWWEHVNLRPGEQRSYYEDLVEKFPPLAFPTRKTEDYRYFIENGWFSLSDAF